MGCIETQSQAMAVAGRLTAWRVFPDRRKMATGLSQEKSGFEVRLDRANISGIERGIRNPSGKNIVKIAQALGVKPSDLLRGAEDQVPTWQGGRMELGKAVIQGKADQP